MTRNVGHAKHLPGVLDVRCKGAVGVIQTAALPQVNQLRQAFIEHGIWLRPFNNMIYMTPPLVISESELSQLCDATVRVTSDWAKQNF
ncbi:MAG: aminotransferase class III-fold pyridoxal phosphate-dependent enzyme [Pirellulaceae bacterium]